MKIQQAESQPMIIEQIIDRAPIIVSPVNSQLLEVDPTKSKDMCNKIAERSVIVRVGSAAEQSVNKINTSEMIVTPTQMEPQIHSEDANQSAPSTHEATETPIPETNKTVATLGSKISHNILLGRWKLSLDLFGRVFMEDVGLEAGSVVSELGGFPVKEAKFRRDMEKLRNSQQKDITLLKV